MKKDLNKTTKYNELLKYLGFNNFEELKMYMDKKAKKIKPTKDGMIYFQIKKKDFEIMYSSNCKYPYMIGIEKCGTFEDISFNAKYEYV